jgi:UDP-glucose 4-epimerase
MSAIFITGGSGFVGAHVVRAFVREGWAVTVFGPSPEPCLSQDDLSKITFLTGSITDAGSVADAINTANPNLVLGLAAYGGTGHGLLASAAKNEASALAVNVQGFHHLLTACAKLTKRPKVIWASTFAVFGGPSAYPGGIANEFSPRKPESFYGLTKVLAEDLAHFFREQHKLEVTGIRLPLVFGPGLWYKGVASQIRELFEIAVQSLPTKLELATEPIELMYVKDVAKAFVHAAKYDGLLDSIYNLTGFPSSPVSIAATLKTALPSANFRIIPTTTGPSYSLVNGDKLRLETGFSPGFNLETACKDYLHELRKIEK